MVDHGARVPVESPVYIHHRGACIAICAQIAGLQCRGSDAVCPQVSRAVAVAMDGQGCCGGSDGRDMRNGWSDAPGQDRNAEQGAEGAICLLCERVHQDSPGGGVDGKTL